MSNKVKSFIMLCVVVLFCGGTHIINKGYNLFTLGEREVALIDVGGTLSSVKNNHYSTMFGHFVDKETGKQFTKPISLTTLVEFDKGNSQPIESVQLFSVDDINGNNYGRLLMFLGTMSNVFAIIFLVVVVEYSRDDVMKWFRKKKAAKIPKAV